MRKNCDVLVLTASDIPPSRSIILLTYPYDVAGCIGQINGRPLSAHEWKCTPAANAVGDYQKSCYDDRLWPVAVNAFSCANGGSNTVSCPYLPAGPINAGTIPGNAANPTAAAPVLGISPLAQWFWTSGFG
jgi:hypothetical protein